MRTRNGSRLGSVTNFRAVTAEQDENEVIGDVLISGMQSNSVPQCHLWKKLLDLKTAVKIARSLETSQV